MTGEDGEEAGQMVQQAEIVRDVVAEDTDQAITRLAHAETVR